MVDGGVTGGIPVASTEGGKAKGGGYIEERQLPQLSDMGNRLYQRVSNFFFCLYYYYFLTVPIGFGGKSAGHAQWPSSGVQCPERT